MAKASKALAPKSASARKPRTRARPTFVCEEAGNAPDIVEASAINLAVAVGTVVTKPKVDQLSTTPNKSSRAGVDIDHIVIHYTTSQSLTGTLNHFKKASSEVSAHYVVGQDGKLVQVVSDSENAWHAGKKSMNRRSIGIEHVAAPGDKITAAQAQKSAALIKWLMQEYDISKTNIIPHVCVKSTNCCGDLFADFGGKGGAPCSVQGSALQQWLSSMSI